jgi:hypothetical protein
MRGARTADGPRVRLRLLVVLLLLGAAAAALAAAVASAQSASVAIDTSIGGGPAGWPEAEGRAPRDVALSFPRDLDDTPAGTVLTDSGLDRVLAVGSDGRVRTIAGTGQAGAAGEGGPATAAQLSDPIGVDAIGDGRGAILVADFGNFAVRRIEADGTIRTMAGTLGQGGPTAEGVPATQTGLAGPRGVAALPDGGFLIADVRQVLRVLPGGTITRVAGLGPRAGAAADGGPATAAGFPEGLTSVAATPDGGFLIAEQSLRVRRVGPDGTITTVAGTDTAGFSGDGGPATAAQLDGPRDAVPTADGGVLISDTGNHRLRRVAPDGTISTVAGTGAIGTAGDGGPPTAADLGNPHGLVAAPRVRVATSGRVRDIGPAAGAPGGGGTAPAGPASGTSGTPAPPAPPGPTGPTGPRGPIGPATADPLRPEARVSVVLAPTRGTVRVRRPGRRTFTRLRGPAAVPVGSEIDVTTGRLDLATARDTRGATQTAAFFGGRFVVRQRGPARRLVTRLTLSGPAPGPCARRAAPRAAVAAAGRRRGKRKRRLWGDGRGRFETEAAQSVTSVRGTRWLVEDRCDGTLTRVTRGVVVVRERRTGRRTTVRAGQAFLARRAAR